MLGKRAVLVVPPVFTHGGLGARRREKEIFLMESAGSHPCPCRRNRRGEGSPLCWRSGPHQSLLPSHGVEGTCGTPLPFSSKLSKTLAQELLAIPRILPFSPDIS